MGQNQRVITIGQKIYAETEREAEWLGWHRRMLLCL